MGLSAYSSASRATIALLFFVTVAPCAAQPLRFTSEGLTQFDGCQASFAEVDTPHGDGVELSFHLSEDGWANVSAPLRLANDRRPITLLFSVTNLCTLDLKFVMKDGSTFGQRVPVEPKNENFCRLTIYPREAEYLWGDSKKLSRPVSFELAVSGITDAGKLTIAAAKIGKGDEPSSFGLPTAKAKASTDDVPLLRVPYRGPLLDPDRELAGYGDRQRRAEQMIPEDPLVLEWLKQMQDTGTPERQFLPSTPGGDEIHTFNNVLAAMAFIRHGERERAERILDFFRDAAVDRDNDDPTRQSFYLRGEARGFFQRVSLHGQDGRPPMHAPVNVDRWMGDMAWLLLACLDYQKTFDSDRYAELVTQVADLLKSWFIADPRGHGGYVQHGWRKGDSHLHEDHGHHEGNIDCYAVFMVLGERELAQKIRVWLDFELAGRNDLPLDLYTWRVLAFNGQHAELLNVPDFDLRYRKSVPFQGRTIIGPYSSPTVDVNNVWLEGPAHMSCAYAVVGNTDRANFYANQLDKAIIEQDVGGKVTHSIPYTATRTGDYEWVNLDEGFVSTAAWYILAKHSFNPLRLNAPQPVDPD